MRCLEEGFDHGLVGEIKLRMGANEKILVSLAFKIAQEGGTEQSAATGDVDFCRYVHALFSASIPE